MRFHPDCPPPPSSTALKDLALLDCEVNSSFLNHLLQYPKDLKRFTYRSDDSDIAEILDEQTPVRYDDYPEGLGLHKSSLEFFDLDIYRGYWVPLHLGQLQELKQLIVTPYTLMTSEVRTPIEENTFPRSLESLTLRYEEDEPLPTRYVLPLEDLLTQLKAKKLPNLREVICHIPNCLPEPWDTARVVQTSLNQVWPFKQLGVDLSVIEVPYPHEMPKYKLCPCENLQYFHRFEEALSAGEITDSWGDDQVPQDDPADVNDSEDTDDPEDTDSEDTDNFAEVEAMAAGP